MVWKNFLFTAAIAVVVTITMTWVGLLVISPAGPPQGSGPGGGTCPSTHLVSVVGGTGVCGIGGLLVSYYLGASTGASITLLGGVVLRLPPVSEKPVMQQPACLRRLAAFS